MDLSIINRAKNGDTDAFEEILASQKDAIRRVCSRFTSCIEDTEDYEREVELQLWLSLSEYRTHETFEGYVYTLALNKCSSLIKARNAAKRGYKVTSSLNGMMAGNDGELPYTPPDLTENVEESAIKNEEKEYLKKCILSLPEKMMVALYITQIEGKTYEEAAVILGVPEGTVKTRVSRARKKIKAMMTVWSRDEEELPKKKHNPFGGRRGWRK